MFRALGKLIGLCVLTLAVVAGLLLYQERYFTSAKVRQLEEDKKQLQQIVTRLESERRVADVLVKSRDVVNNIPQTTLLFVEYDRAGNALPAKTFTIAGTSAHIDAMVIKFDHDFVAQNDPLRGHSIALFTKIYGDNQSPASAIHIDEPDSIPDVYRAADPRVTEFETKLWKDFWKLYEDESYRKNMGVRALGGHGVWGPFEPGRLYTLTLESDGGLNLVSEPLKGIYREALKPAS
jgi:hypothetical protein